MLSWAPGRVNLIGEHTDYTGGLVLPVAIEQGVEVRGGEAKTIALESESFGTHEPFSADGSGPQVGGWARYAQAVAVELAELGRPPVGFAGRVTSSVPSGAGLSSSAAVEVAIALALCAVADFELEPLALALACQRAELRAVGVPCGILDQAASVLGRAGHAVLLDCGSLEHRLVPVPARAALIVLDSGVAHEHESSGYAARQKELRAGVPARVRHVESENQRVRNFVTALELDDLPTAGDLLFASHASLRDDYEVSTPELDLLVEVARDAGALGARLVGGGFGGSILALAESADAPEIAEAIARSYRAKTGHAQTPLFAVPAAGAGVRA